MESATIRMPPSTGLSGILLSARTQYSWRNMHGEKFDQLHSERTTAVF